MLYDQQSSFTGNPVDVGKIGYRPKAYAVHIIHFKPVIALLHTGCCSMTPGG